jgi:hypothetical protein
MKILFTTILGVALIIAGEMLGFFVFSSYTQGGFLNGFLGITAFISIFLGIILAIKFPILCCEKK